jgi:translation initiation factor 2B subunit (eIF-2B alpha/beta/delta family)/ADP-ribose pyrophosphatase YjhB (NUDIX family)
MLVDTHVVTCFLRHRGEVLLLRRSGKVGSYRGLWGAVAGYVEGSDPDGSALREVAEETGLALRDAPAARGEPFPVEDPQLGKRWIVHPYLFDSPSRDLRLDWESSEAEWVSPTEILRRASVPGLWKAYLSVAPAIASVSADRRHGSAYLSLRALEILRDRAGALAMERAAADPSSWRELSDLASRLVEARPSMTALSNRVHRVMHRASSDPLARRVEEEAHAAIARALDDDDRAADRASALVAGKRVLTFSRSGTVTEALLRARPRPEVVVAESRPGGEGVSVAEELSTAGMKVTLIADAGIAEALEGLAIQMVLVGADSVLPSGSVINKIGTRLTAIAAHAVSSHPVPFYAAASTDKISKREDLALETADSGELYRGGANVQIRNPLFEVTPSDWIRGIVAERGVLTPQEVEPIARELSSLASWRGSEPADGTL